MSYIGVFGSSGFVGRAFIRYCKDKNFRVKEFGPWTETSEKDLQIFLKNCSSVVNFIGRFQPPFREQMESNVLIIDKICNEVSKSSVKKLVHVSAAAAYGTSMYGSKPSEETELIPDTSYGLSKKMGEDILKYYHINHGLSYIIVRPTNIYGIHSDHGVVYSVLNSFQENGQVTINGDGKQKRDFIFVTDFIKLLITLIKTGKKNEIYNAGSGDSVSIIQLIKLIENVIQKKIPIVYQKADETVVKELAVSIEKVQRDFEWKPRVTLTDGIKLIYSSLES